MKQFVRNFFPVILLGVLLFCGNRVAEAQCDNQDIFPTALCDDAPIVCFLDGFCSTMPQSTSAYSATICGQGIALNNPYWFSFIATSTTVTVTITPSRCQGVSGQFGMQGAIVSTCPPPPGGGTYATVGNCAAACMTNTFTLGAGGVFVVGQQYWIMLDGCAGDICDFEITATQGITAPILTDPVSISGPLVVCPGETATFTVNDPQFASTFYWVVDGDPRTTTGRSVQVVIPSNAPDGTFEICLDDAENACYNLVDDNGYTGNVCFEVEVQSLPITYAADVTWCEDNAPYVRDGFNFYPPSGMKEYQMQSPRGCDSTIRFNIEFIKNNPDDDVVVVCAEDLPYYHPILGALTNPGDYPVDWLDRHGCDSSYNFQLAEMIFNFDVRIPTNVLECPDETIEIDASQTVVLLSNGDIVLNVQYNWLLNGQDQGVQGTYLTVRAGDAGTWTLEVIGEYDGVICTQTYDFEITENFNIPESPVIIAPPSGCIGNVLEVGLGNWDGEAEIYWYPGTGYTILSGQGTPNISIELTDASTDVICVRLNKPDCPLLSVEDCITLVISAELDAGVTGDLRYCQGSGTTLTAGSGFSTYAWSTPPGGTTQSIQVTSPGDYTVTVTNNSGCSGVQTVTVEEVPTPDPTITGSTTFCTGLSSQIGVVETFVSYLWNTGATTQSITVNVETTYTVTVEDANGCTGTKSISVTEATELRPTITGDLAFCAGDCVTLSATGFASYIWSTGETGSSVQVCSGGTVSVTVTDAGGCTGNTSVSVTEHANPVAGIGASKVVICPEETLDLSGQPGSGVTYEWSGSLGTGPVVTVDGAGDYGLTVTDGNGCVGTASVTVTEHISPVPTISGDEYFCAGLSADIGVDQQYASYAWSPSPLPSAQNITVNTANTYTVTVTDVNGCTATSSHVVREESNPVPVITGDGDLCQGESTTLSTTQGYAGYLWNGTETTPTYVVSTTGTTTVAVTDANGCVGTGSFNVTVHANPVPVIGGSKSYCIGRTTTLDAGNYAGYLWSTGATGREIVVGQEGTYGVTVTDVNGCTGTSSVAVTEDTELRTDITGDRSFCAGLTTTLDAGPGFAKYTWCCSPGITEPGNRFVTVGIAGTYTVTVEDATGCTGSASVVVEQNSNPVPEITGPGSFCTGRTATLDAGSGYISYQWSTQGINRTIEVNETGTYTVTVTDANGCVGTSSKYVEELERLVPAITGDLGYCVGDSTELCVEAGYTSYEWQGPGNVTDRCRYVTASGTYVVTVEDASGCTGTNAVTVTEYVLPVSDAGVDRELTCRDSIQTIGGSGTSTGNYSYRWEEIANGGGVQGTSRELRVRESGTYVLEVVNLETGCVNVDTVVVRQNDNLITGAEVEGLDPKCFNESNGVIRVLDVEGGVGPYTYYINGTLVSEGTQRSLGPGNYRIRIEDVNGCWWEESVQLTNPERLVVDAGPDRLLEYGDTLVINPEVNAPADRLDITWSEGSTVLCTGCPGLSLFVEPQLATTYTITVIDENDCVATDFMRVNLKRTRRVFIPGAFSPNGDAVNDRFMVFGGQDVVRIVSLRVYDRWGGMMYEASDLTPGDPEAGWDGTIDGRRLDPAVFTYVTEVEFNDGEIFKYFGDVTLIK